MTTATVTNSPPKITVIFLLYSEAGYVPGLFRAILAQRHPTLPNQSDWLEVMFVDNGSKDNTLAVMQEEMKRAGSPPNYRIEAISPNAGIAGAMNRAFNKVTTPFALSCHCDCLFGREDYVSRMLELLARHPEAGAITGQPAIPKKGHIPFPEKVNLIVNLMDIFPAESRENDGLVPVGFNEGRCDGFRLEALRSVNFYDTTLKLAGEDQVMSARMRQNGYQIYQAPELPYMLSVSNDQDSLMKLARHQRVFGRAHPYIVLKTRKAVTGLTGKAAGSNRKARTFLRLLQVGSAVGCLATIAALAFAQFLLAAIIVFAIWLAKQVLFARHMRTVGLTVKEWFVFYSIQPALDVSYTIGLINGIWLAFFRSKPIA